MSSDGDRDHNGRFLPGCAPGPGRPKRVVESQYLKALSDSVSLDTWQEIVEAAIDKAKDGDGTARAWLSRLLLGSEPPKLSGIAADELRGQGDAEAIAGKAQSDGVIDLALAKLRGDP